MKDSIEIAKLKEQLNTRLEMLARRMAYEMFMDATQHLITCNDRYHLGVIQSARRYLEALDDFPASDPASSIIDLRAAMRPYTLDLGVPEYPVSPDISA